MDLYESYELECDIPLLSVGPYPEGEEADTAAAVPGDAGVGAVAPGVTPALFAPVRNGKPSSFLVPLPPPLPPPAPPPGDLSFAFTPTLGLPAPVLKLPQGRLAASLRPLALGSGPALALPKNASPSPLANPGLYA